MNDTEQTLRQVVRLLTRASRVPGIDGQARLACLASIEAFDVRNEPGSPEPAGSSAGDLIREALRLLSALTLDDFADPGVRNGARHARDALRWAD